MERDMRLSMFLLVFCLAAVSGCRAETQDADPYSFDFGVIPGTKPVSHTFVLRNTGEKPLQITGRTNSCGCITSEIDKETIPPGESASLTATFDPAGYKGKESQFVYITTDDPENSVYKFTVNADVK